MNEDLNVPAVQATHTSLRNMIELNLKALEFFKNKPYIMAQIMRPLLIMGKPGIGKTVGIREAAQELGLGYKEIRLASMSEIEVGGLPMVAKDEKGRSYTTYAASQLLPDADRDGEIGVLVLDEITSCNASLRAVALQLLDASRGIGEYKLPDKWFCICLGNDAGDGGVYTGLEAAFMNRCRMVRMIPDFDGWLKWASTHDIHPTVMAYLNFNQGEHFYVDPTDDCERIGASPRSWEGVSVQLQLYEEYLKKAGGVATLLDSDSKSKSIDKFVKDVTKAEKLRMTRQAKDEFETVVCGDLALNIASEFAAFYAHSAGMIDPQDILDGKAEIGDSMSAVGEAMAITLEAVKVHLLNMLRVEEKRENGSSVKRLKHKEEVTAEDRKKLNNYIEFLMDLTGKKGADTAMVSLKSLVKNEKKILSYIIDKSFVTEYPDTVKYIVAMGGALTDR